LSEVFYEAVFLGIEMNVVDELCKIAVRINLDPSEAILKKAAGPFISGIYSLGIAVEKV
jgi:hypothetical protein